jgi:23S rRNA pseudouridine2605 synthase
MFRCNTMRPHQQYHGSEGGATGLARALSKLGYCSRSLAVDLIRAGKVQVDGRICRDPQYRVHPVKQHIEVEEHKLQAAKFIYLALNKPRGLVTTRSDEKGRPTVYQCFEGRALPFISPVGRLDQASEGLLLFTNDTAWAAPITDPASMILKIYHVQIDCVPEAALVSRLREGVSASGEHLEARSVEVLRAGTRNGWLQIMLDEGKNRHIRRLLEAFGISVRRLVRIAIGPLKLGDIPKGAFRELSHEEVDQLRVR